MPPCLVLTLAHILTSLCPTPTNPNQTFQKIHGFGGALTQSSATVYKELPEELQAAVIEAYYGPTGIGYTTGRMPIHSCDFSVDTYTFDDVAGDYDLGKFDTTVAHDRNLSLPMIHAAIAANPSLKLFGSPWSPPAWMKDNNDMLWGGSLLDEAKESWAQVMKKRTTCGLPPGFRGAPSSTTLLSHANTSPIGSPQWIRVDHLDALAFVQTTLQHRQTTDIRSVLRVLTVTDPPFPSISPNGSRPTRLRACPCGA